MNKVDWTKVDFERFTEKLRLAHENGKSFSFEIDEHLEREPNEPITHKWSLSVELEGDGNCRASISSASPEWRLHFVAGRQRLQALQVLVGVVNGLASECLKKPKHPFIGRSVKGAYVTHVTEKWGLELPELNSRARPPIGACWARTPFGELGLLSEVNGLLVFRAVVGTEKEISLYQTLTNEFYSRPRSNPGVVPVAFSPQFTVSF